MIDLLQNSNASTMGEVLLWQAARRPEKRVFTFLDRGERETQSLTFAELNARAQGIAQVLRAYGLSGQRVILAYPSCLEFVAALFGCFFAGAIAVPAPVAGYRNSSARTRAISADANPSAVLSLRSLISKCAENSSEVSGPPVGECEYIATDEIASSAVCLPPDMAPGGLALLQYTSGSTGTPRGVMITHSNLIHNQRVLCRALDSHAEETGVSWLPLYHDMGLVGAILHPVYGGGFCALMTPLSFLQNPSRWLKAIQHYRASITMAPCFAYGLCVRHHRPGRDVGLDLSSWRVAICGGETIRPETLEKFAQTFRDSRFNPQAILPAYGLAEATLLATSSTMGRGLITRSPAILEGEQHHSFRHFACCGKTWEEQRVAIVDPSSHRRVPPGKLGEVWLQGPSVAAGYWNRSEETKEAFEATLAGEAGSGAWLRTGDLGFLSPEGLVVTGRCKDIVVIRGVNYDPLDFEAEACESHPFLSPECAVAFAIDHQASESVVMIFELEREVWEIIDAISLVNDIVLSMNRRFGLAIYDVLLVRLGTLPRTTSGKLQRHRCRELYLAGDLAASTTIDHPAFGRCRPQAQGFA